MAWLSPLTLGFWIDGGCDGDGVPTRICAWAADIASGAMVIKAAANAFENALIQISLVPIHGAGTRPPNPGCSGGATLNRPSYKSPRTCPPLAAIAMRRVERRQGEADLSDSNVNFSEAEALE